jgi:hypothetical protein
MMRKFSKSPHQSNIDCKEAENKGLAVVTNSVKKEKKCVPST